MENKLIKPIYFEKQEGITVKEAKELLDKCDEDAILLFHVGRVGVPVRKIEAGLYEPDYTDSYSGGIVRQDEMGSLGMLNIRQGLDNGTMQKAIILDPYLHVEEDEEE